MATVGRDQVLAGEITFVAAIDVTDAQRHAGGILAQAGHLGALQHLGPRVARLRAQDGLEAGAG
jgi:hypothetical protein